jgi:hypothetical protein
MDAHRIITTIGTAATLAAGWLTLPAPAAAHCDSLDGPVVRDAFDLILRIRALGPAAEAAAPAGH